MKTYKSLFGLIGFSIAIVFLTATAGCDTEEAELVAFTQAIPANGSTIEADTTIVVTFDGNPTDVNVTGGTFSVSGPTVTITGPFTPGTLNLTVTWADGTQPLAYTVEASESDGPDAAADFQGMVRIDAGEFRMGSNNGMDSEKPIHSVYVDAFYMDKYEVTNAEYAAFLNAKGKHAEAGKEWYRIGHPSSRIEYVSRKYQVKGGYANHPVTFVSWCGAMAYAEWAGKRLPTEAEWEKAARGGLSGLKYPWGNAIDSTNANYNNDVKDTTAIGKYTANGYGLYDMSGNVWEWCLDEMNLNFYSVSPAQNPLSGASSIQWLLDNYIGVSNTYSIIRGGAWNRVADQVRVAFRGRFPRTSTHPDCGFRCVKSVTP